MELRISIHKREVIIVLLLLYVLTPLVSAIVMEVPRTEVQVIVTDRKDERANLPSTTLVLPLCSISLTAKHKGSGYLEIVHTPLDNGLVAIPYTLRCDETGEELGDLLSYTCDPYIPTDIALTTISAVLARPLTGSRSSYRSRVFLHLVLDT